MDPQDQEIQDNDYDAELDQASFAIGLMKTADGTGYLRLLNDPAAPYQREHVVQNPGVLEIQCRSREIIHGKISADSDEFATLLVYDVHLDATKRSRRIRSVTIEFVFSSSEAGHADPEVYKIAPFRRWSVSPSTRDETTTVGGELQVGAPELIAKLGTTAKWERTASSTTTDESRVTGSIWTDDYGKPVTARWRLEENESTKSGVPNFLRCAILLKRHSTSLFESSVKIKVKSDWKSNVESLFGSTPRDDPILFDPAMAPTNKLNKAGYDEDNLDSLDLHREFAQIRFSAAFVSGRTDVD